MKKKLSYLILLLIILISVATFFRSTKILFAAFALITILILDYCALLHKGKKFTEGVSISRKFDRPYILRGGEVSASCTLESAYRPGKASVEVRDIPPNGTTISQVNDLYQYEDGRYKARYTLLCNAHGILSHGGIRLTVSDSLFETSIRMPLGEMPLLHVLPRPEFTRKRENIAYGEDTDAVTPVMGSNIRDYREYSASDDPRHIDWKMSAKHGKLYVKKYTFIEGISESLIIDLPDMEMITHPEDLEKLKSIAGNLIIEEQESKREIKLIRISGPNLIKVERMRKFSEEISKMTGEMAPVRRTSHMYRYKRYLPSVHGARNNFSGHLNRLQNSFNPSRMHHIFENQIAGILQYQKSTEITVVTLGRGDLSHLRIISDTARKYRMRTACYTPKQEEMDQIEKNLSGCGFNRLEVI